MPLRILLAVWGESGNLAPALTAARRLRSAGHHPHILAAPALAREVLTEGLGFTAWRQAPPYARPKEDEAGMAPSAIGELCAGVLFGPATAIAHDVLDTLREAPADCVVLHDFLIGGALAAEAMRLPCALLSPHVSLRPLPGVPPLGSGLGVGSDATSQAQVATAHRKFLASVEQWLPELNEARVGLGLPRLESVLEQFDRIPRILLAMSPAFDFPCANLPGNVRYVGPLLDQPGGLLSQPFAWPEQSAGAKLLISLGTSFQGQGPVLQRVMQAVNGTDLVAIATAGPVMDAALEPPANVSLIRGASHDTLMPQVSVVVTHGGHGTVLRALTHGRPMLVLPMGRDQDDNAARVVACGAGMTLSPEAPPDAIRAAVQQLRSEARFTRAAQAMGQIIAADVASASLVREIEALVDQKPASQEGPLLLQQC